MQLKLLWMGAVNMPAYRKAATEAVPDQCDNRYPEDFIERYNGPFVEVPGCGALGHMLPEEWGFIPNEIPSDVFENGDFWWSLGVKDDLGREIILKMEVDPDVDYESTSDYFTINTPNQPSTMTDIQELVERFEPQIDHWWCHRNTSANPSERKDEKKVDEKQNWWIAVDNFDHFFTVLDVLVVEVGKLETVEDHVKVHFIERDGLLTARLVNVAEGSGDSPEVVFDEGEVTIHYCESSLERNRQKLDFLVYYNAFREMILKHRVCDSFYVTFDESKSDRIVLEFKKVITFADDCMRVLSLED